MPFGGLLAVAIGGIASGVAGAGVNLIGQSLGGQKGAGFQAQSANLENPFANQQVQQAMGAQSAAAQGSTQALGQQQQLIQALKSQGGLQNQSQVYNQGQNLAAQLGDMAQGNGPNPALAQLANTTGQNIQQQSALMASQRGASANAGLLARQAAMQGGALQQNAVGQAAALRAQQQISAIGQLQQQQGMLGSLASNQAANQIGATQAGAQLAQAQQGLTQQQQAQILGAQQAAQNLQLQNVSQQNQANSGVAGINAHGMQGQTSGLASGLASGITSLASPTTSGSSAGSISTNTNPIGQTGFGIGGQSLLAQGGQVGSQAMLKENYKGKSRMGAMLMASGGKVHAMQTGGKVPGSPKVAGAVDSYANDVVNAKLSPGEIVLPRSVTMSADPVSAAAKFVAAIQARKGRK